MAAPVKQESLGFSRRECQAGGLRKLLAKTNTKRVSTTSDLVRALATLTRMAYDGCRGVVECHTKNN